MTKHYSRAAKRKLKKAMPKLAPIPRRKTRGSARMSDIDTENKRSNLEARARQLGKPIKDADQMRAQMLGEQAGQALYLLCEGQELHDLWGHYTALTSAEARYHRSLGKSIHPKTARIEAMREVFETRDDDTPDLRTEEERDRDAVRRWMHWQGNIMRIHGHLQAAIYSAYRHHSTLVDQGKVTHLGKTFVEAMREMDKRIG